MTQNTRTRRASEVVLLLISIVWGSCFVVAHVALAAGLPSLFILLCRFLLAALFLGVLHAGTIRREFRRAHLKDGVLLGAVCLSGFYFQMLGLQYSTPSNNAIIVSFNVVIVPFLWWVASRVRPPRMAFLCCAISLVGIAVISVDLSEGFAIHGGDLFSLLSAVLYAGQIVCVGEMTKRVDHRILVFLQFLVAGLLALGLFALSGEPFAQTITPAGALSVLYLTAVCTCLCFLLQAWAMRRVDSARASVIMSTEALFGAALSILVGVDPFSWRIVAGALLLFVSVALPELTGKRSVESALESD